MKYYDYRSQVGPAKCVGHGYVQLSGVCWRPSWCKSVYAAVLREQIEEEVQAAYGGSDGLCKALFRVLYSRLPVPLFLHFSRLKQRTMRFLVHGESDANKLAEALLDASSEMFAREASYTTICSYLHFCPSVETADAAVTVEVACVSAAGTRAMTAGFIEFVNSPLSRAVAETCAMWDYTFFMHKTNGSFENVDFMARLDICASCGGVLVAPHKSLYNVTQLYYRESLKRYGYSTCCCVTL